MRSLKRVLDLLAAGFGLVLMAPILLFLILWLRLTGTRSAFHSEWRVGRHGLHFAIHKLRTLREGSPAKPSVVTPDDPRLTRTGSFLRRWRLDELPQLWDVLRGSMSLIGPRPQNPDNLEAIDPDALEKLQRVRPGITGPAVIEFLSEEDAVAGVDDPDGVYRRVVLPAKVRIELEYLEHWSLLSDLRIALLTVARIFSKRARRRSLGRVRSLIEASQASPSSASAPPPAPDPTRR